MSSMKRTRCCLCVKSCNLVTSVLQECFWSQQLSSLSMLGLSSLEAAEWRRSWLLRREFARRLSWTTTTTEHTSACIHLTNKACYPLLNPLECRGNYSATSNDMKLVHWPLMGGQLYLVQRWGDWAAPQPTQALPRCTNCSSPPINGQCTNHRIAVWWSGALRF